MDSQRLEETVMQGSTWEGLGCMAWRVRRNRYSHYRVRDLLNQLV